METRALSYICYYLILFSFTRSISSTLETYIYVHYKTSRRIYKKKIALKNYRVTDNITLFAS